MLSLEPIHGNGYQTEDGTFIAPTQPYEAGGKTWFPAGSNVYMQVQAKELEEDAAYRLMHPEG